MLLSAINYARGNIRIEIRGAAVERFLNLCAQNGVEFWKLKRIEEDTVRATVRIEGFRKLHLFAGKTMCHVHILRRSGVPFLLERLRPRVALWLGMLICLAGVWVSGKFLWEIRIEGCEAHQQAEVLRLAEASGLHTGMLGSKVDTDEVKRYILSHSEKYAFVSVNIKGTRAEITAYPRAAQPAMIPQDQPCDIIADKAGIIDSAIVRSGVKIKKIGETVLEGDPLVSGLVMNENGEWFMVHSQADITLRTWRKIQTAMPATVMVKTETGRSKTRWSLVLGRKRLSLSLIESEPFACYDKHMQKKTLKLGENNRLPLALVCERYAEIKLRPFTISEELCKETLQQRQEEMLSRWLPDAKVVKAEFSCDYTEKVAKGIFSAECREQAGILKKITEVPTVPEEKHRND